MNILEQTKNFKINQSLEKILLISALSMLPNQINSNPNFDTYNISNTHIQSPNQNPNIQNPIHSQSNQFNLNLHYGVTFKTLRYELTPNQILYEKIKSNIDYNI